MEENEIVDDSEAKPLSTAFVVVIYGKVVFNLVASLACFFFIAAILSKPKIRSKAYNLYVVFMILPDGINTFFRVLTNLFIASEHGIKWFPPGYYYFDLFFWMFYYMSNFYTNALVTYEINKLVEHSNRGKRLPVPKVQKVCKQVAAVYLFAASIAALMVLPVPFAIFHITDERRGEGTVGGGPDGWFTFSIATLIVSVLIMIPSFYVVFIRIQMWRKKLLPPEGRTRVLTLFFLRVVIIFLLFYIPNLLLTVFRNRMDDESTGAFVTDTILGILAACQALTTLYMIRLKDDIRNTISATWNDSFGRLICCFTCLDWSDEVDISTASRPPTGFSWQAKNKSGNLGSPAVGRSLNSDTPASPIIRRIQSAWSEVEFDTGSSRHQGASGQVQTNAEQPKISGHSEQHTKNKTESSETLNEPESPNTHVPTHHPSSSMQGEENV